MQFLHDKKYNASKLYRRNKIIKFHQLITLSITILSNYEIDKRTAAHLITLPYELVI